MHSTDYFKIDGKTAVVTGGGGVLCSSMAIALACAGVRVAVLNRSLDKAEAVVDTIRQQQGQAIAVGCDVLDKASLAAAAETVEQAFGPVDFLINGAGGNKPQATTSPDLSFFDLPADAAQYVFNLNFIGTLLSTQVFAKGMVARGEGCILNISSMNAFRPLTRVASYSAAKAAVSNFTQWLAVHLAQEYSPGIRVNALAPGFFHTQQNHYLLIDERSGAMTERGQKIIDHTPLNRYGKPEDLHGAMFFLLSPAAAFVTGVVIPIDGGFSAFSGV